MLTKTLDSLRESIGRSSGEPTRGMERLHQEEIIHSPNDCGALLHNCYIVVLAPELRPGRALRSVKPLCGERLRER